MDCFPWRRSQYHRSSSIGQLRQGVAPGFFDTSAVSLVKATQDLLREVRFLEGHQLDGHASGLGAGGFDEDTLAVLPAGQLKDEQLVGPSQQLQVIGVPALGRMDALVCQLAELNERRHHHPALVDHLAANVALRLQSCLADCGLGMGVLRGEIYQCGIGVS